MAAASEVEVVEAFQVTVALIIAGQDLVVPAVGTEAQEQHITDTLAQPAA